MNNLIIIGNGFDLAHNMKTSYNHFVQYLIDSHIESKLFNDLFTNNLSFKNHNEFFRLVKKNAVFLSDYIENNVLNFMIDEIATNNWSDVENLYFKLLNNNTKKYPYGDPKQLNLEFQTLKSYLAGYLKMQQEGSHPIESYEEMFSIIDSKETTILNFNYTNTLKNLYSTEIKESRIIHIHGELSNPKNPIIFGYAANDEESRQLIDKGDNEYMRNIKKHLYKRTENEKLLTNYLYETESINVTILGHSCGLSDKLILNQILNNKNIESINIFYYEEYEQYFQIQVNIDRIMNNDHNFKKLVDFNSSHRMPQHNDTLKQKSDFMKYISTILNERKERKRQRNLTSNIL